jgi:hypothetical protein
VESLDLKDIGFGEGDDDTHTLWAYPAQCNVKGSRLGLGLTRELKRHSKASVRRCSTLLILNCPRPRLDTVR